MRTYAKYLFAIAATLSGILYAGENGWRTERRIGFPVLRHGTAVQLLRFSSDGKKLCSFGDGKARVWDLSDPIAHQDIQGKFLRAMSFSDKAVALVDGATGPVVVGMDLKPLRPKKRRGVYYRFDISLSPDAGTLAFCSEYCEILQTKGLTTHRRIPADEASLKTMGSALHAEFSPDGKRLLIEWDTWGPAVHDPLTGKTQCRLVTGVLPMGPMAWSADGKRIGAIEKNSVSIWDSLSGKYLLQYQLGKAPLKCFAFSPNGKLIAAGTQKGELVLYDIETQKTVRRKRYLRLTIESLVFSPNGKRLAVGGHRTGDGLILLLPGDPKARWPDDDDLGWRLAVAPLADNRTIALGGEAPDIQLVDVVSGKTKGSLRGHKDWVTSLALSPDGKLLLSGSGDETVRGWDPDNGKERFRIKCQRWVSDVAFSRDGKLLSACVNDRVPMVWDTATRKLKAECGTQRLYGARAVAFFPNGKPSLHFGNKICCFDPPVGVFGLGRQFKSIMDLQLNRMKTRLYAVSNEGIVFLFDSKSDSRKFLDIKAPLRCLAVNDGEKLMALGGTDHKIYLLRLPDGKLLQTLSGHVGPVTSLCFTPNGKRLISTSGDTTAIVWTCQ